MKRIIVLAAVALLLPATAAPQALTSLSSVRVRYSTQKATVRPQGELKAQIDEIDRQIAEATRLGQIGELRRLFAKGTTLLAGREWTDATRLRQLARHPQRSRRRRFDAARTPSGSNRSTRRRFSSIAR